MATCLRRVVLWVRVLGACDWTVYSCDADLQHVSSVTCGWTAFVAFDGAVCCLFIRFGIGALSRVMRLDLVHHDSQRDCRACGSDTC